MSGKYRGDNTTLGLDDGFEMIQHDWLTESQDQSSIECANETHSFSMGIYFGDTRDNNERENPEEPYYALRWPSDLDRREVASFLKKIGERFGIVPNEHLEDIDSLEPGFHFARVDTEDFAIVWGSDESLSETNGKPAFGVITNHSINDGYVRDIVKETIALSERHNVDAALETLNRIFEHYTFATLVSEVSPTPA